MGDIEILLEGLQSDLGPVRFLQTAIISFTVGVPIFLHHVTLGVGIVRVVIVLSSTTVSVPVVVFGNKDLVISVTERTRTYISLGGDVCYDDHPFDEFINESRQ